MGRRPGRAAPRRACGILEGDPGATRGAARVVGASSTVPGLSRARRAVPHGRPRARVGHFT